MNSMILNLKVPDELDLLTISDKECKIKTEKIEDIPLT
jgi:hypothetical protein